METTTTSAKSIKDAILLLMDGHTQLFNNVLVDLTDEDAQKRLGAKANHMSWIAGSMVYARYDLARLLGATVDYTPNPLFTDYKGLDDSAAYPSISSYKKDWEMLTPILRKAIEELTEEKMASADPFEMPGGPYRLDEAVLYCFDRESYCIGQLGIGRRILGYDAMKYE